MIEARIASCVLAALGLAACGRAPSEDGAALSALQGRIAALEQRKTLVADSNDIERLQAAYGYYFDRGLWDEVADLFADDGTIEVALDGVYVGKARVREYLYALGGGRAGLAEGRLSEHLQVMPVITLAADGSSAKARWRGIVLEGDFGRDAFWGEGPYENEYVKENGVWKIKALHWYQALLRAVCGRLANESRPDAGQARVGRAAAGSAAVRRLQDLARDLHSAIQLPESRSRNTCPRASREVRDERPRPSARAASRRGPRRRARRLESRALCRRAP